MAGMRSWISGTACSDCSYSTLRYAIMPQYVTEALLMY
jgi:hypothetical protein